MPPPTLLLGISGPSSSGKTTLSRLLRDILPGSFILHEDDFYKPDASIPVQDGLADWDCLDSLDLPALAAALAHIKRTGRSPPDLHSKEDLNSVGPVAVDDALVDQLKAAARAKFGSSSGGGDDGGAARVAIVDGFLLYAEAMAEIRAMFDVKLFLRTDYATAKARREARKGYVTLEGFWEDPPEYVDRVVWPNYVADHAFLFEDGDVEGKVKGEVCGELGIEVVPDAARGDMSACLRWAFGVVERALEEKSNGAG